MDIIIQFHGIKNVKKPKVLKEYLESLLRYAPSQSVCYLHIFKEPHSYLCKLTVHSTLKTFSAYHKNECLTDTIRVVLRSVKKQIAFWKKNRSSEELTGIISVEKLNLTELSDLEVPNIVISEENKKVS